jgi:cellulose synthase/poly-beta-1,6-N-acetylglucosamine synthase-like glycosyltransferase
MTDPTEDRFALASKIGSLQSPDASEVALTVLGLLITSFAAFMLTAELAAELSQHLAGGHEGAAAERAVFAAIALLLIYGNVVYQLARLGHYWRKHRHQPLSRDELEIVYAPGRAAAPLTMLVPSYKEERLVIWQTLFSAALVEWPNRRVVLLLDDPPAAKAEEDRLSLAAARALPEQLNGLLRQPATQMKRELHSFQTREGSADLDETAELHRLADLYDQAAAWLERQADVCPASTHIDALFVARVLREPARLHRERAEDLRQEARARQTPAVRSRICREYRRLAGLFDVEVTSFERKQFVNLSHEPNKAMNLNAYISLLGRSFRVRRQIGTNLLEVAPEPRADLRVADADYLITLDADSLLLSDYALRLVHVLEQAGNERVAVVQTPYTAIPGAETALERVAGATTDIQHIVHQGFTHWNGTYWVGANALLRRRALEDIKSVEYERGFPVSKYIESRTVIEDTESSIDLINKGWTLFNYPDRLAYSATPPDFGALLIQRRRWANGGLLILPKLMRYLFQGPFRLRKAPEVFVRAHYLVSIAATNLGVLALLVYPFEPSTESILWLTLSAVPYYVFYGRDLVRAGYRWGDLLRVNALNLALLPVNLGGVLASIRQGITGAKTPFLRTPKVTGRTAVPAAYLVAGYALLSLGVVGSAVQATDERWLYAAFALGNAAFFGYAAVVFVGLRASAEDIATQLAPPLRRVAVRLKESRRQYKKGGKQLTAKSLIPPMVARPRRRVGER